MTLTPPLTNFESLSLADRLATWDQALQRLRHLAGNDIGYFVLASYSLIEAWLNSQNPDWQFETGPHSHGFGRNLSFRDKIDHLVAQHPDCNWEEELRQLSKSYWLTTAVRHHFAQLELREASTIGTRLLTFSRKAHLGSEAALKEFEQATNAWTEGMDISSLLKRLMDLEKVARESRTNGQQLQQSLVDLAATKSKLNAAERELSAKERTILEIGKDETDGTKAREKEHRQELWELNQQVRKLRGTMASQDKLLAYLDELQGMHQASRTHLDYQRTIMRLSKEQEEVLSSFQPGEDFLVRGGAGTGKTLVLIKAIKAIRVDEKYQLQSEPRQKVLLLTFTKTLIRYGRYLGNLIAAGQSADDIQTVDAWMLGLGLKLLANNCKVLFKPHELSGVGLKFPESAVWNEIEDFVWARGLTRQQYVVEAVPRTGRKRAVTREHREAVWDTSEVLLAAMREKGTFSRYGLRTEIWRLLQLQTIDTPREFDVIAVDEVQDLAPVDLLIIKQQAARSVIMAGDTQQSLYQAGFTFKSAGIDIERRSRILKRNYRNTRPIEALASAFLEASGASSGEKTATTAIRDGLPPRLSLYHKKEGFLPALAAALDFYQDVLEYQDSSIAILHPGLEETQMATITKLLHDRKSFIVHIKDREDWIDAEGIRISTIHSAKGLDFPVVILLLPKINSSRDVLEDNVRHEVETSLLYVGLTRALENLNIILPEETQSTCLLALRKAFEEQTAKHVKGLL